MYLNGNIDLADPADDEGMPISRVGIKSRFNYEPLTVFSKDAIVK